MNRLRMLIIISIVNLLSQANFSGAYDWPEARVTVHLVSEDGTPVSSEQVTVSFELPEGRDQRIKYERVSGFTDANGLFTATHKTIGNVGCKINKEGFYGSYGEYRFHNEQASRWLPWNPEIKLVLRKKENPVPMYARDTQVSELRIPAVGKNIGFDLMEYDWVPPYGHGKQADFIFRFDQKFKSPKDFESVLILTFSNKHDGIQLIKENRKYGSVFKLPRFAPKTGYKNKLVRSSRHAPGKAIEDDSQDDNNYIFRVRSEERDGKLVRAMYGKIQGDIKVYPYGAQTGRIYFIYYFNPDYTRNLEYGENLFRNLGPGEEPGLEK